MIIKKQDIDCIRKLASMVNQARIEDVIIDFEDRKVKYTDINSEAIELIQLVFNIWR